MDPMQFDFNPPYSYWALHPIMKVKRAPGAKMPTRSNPTDAGLDLYALENRTIEPGQRAIIKTGIHVEFPAGFALFIHDRSGLSTKHGLHRLAGVVDAGYSGEVGVVLINLGQDSYTINQGDKIGQAVLTPIALPILQEVDELSQTSRGDKGYGSTGK